MLCLVALCVVECGLSSFVGVVRRLAVIDVLNRFVLRFVALCVVRGALPSCVDLCCVWLLCVLFAVVCRLALRLVALCVGRCGV
mgnify:CR=1 FL=1